jgi:hypothetical protein
VRDLRPAISAETPVYGRADVLFHALRIQEARTRPEWAFDRVRAASYIPKWEGGDGVTDKPKDELPDVGWAVREAMKSPTIQRHLVAVQQLRRERDDLLETLRLTRCTPDPAQYVSVEEVRKVLEGFAHYSAGRAFYSAIEAILPKPKKRDPLEELEQSIREGQANREGVWAPRWDSMLALVRQAMKERK